MNHPSRIPRVPFSRRVFPALASTLLLCLPAGCGKGGSTPPGGMGQAPPMTVMVTAAETRNVPYFSEFVTSLDPGTSGETVEIRARVEAILLQQHFVEGQPVRKGQVLFTLDSRTYEADLKTARAGLSKAKADLDYARNQVLVEQAAADLESAQAQLALARVNEARLKPLAEQKAVPRQDYDDAATALLTASAAVNAKKANLDTVALNRKVSIEQAEAAILSAEADIRRAEINLEYCTVCSPIAGLAGRRQVAPGNLVGHGEATLLTSVSALDPIRVTFSISETDYLRHMEIVKRQGRDTGSLELELVLSTGESYPHKGRILVADRAVDARTGTLSIIGEFPNPDRLLRPGMYGRVRFRSFRMENALVVPLKAVADLQGAKTVLVAGPDGKVSLRTVVLGPAWGELIVVLEGLKAGENVIVEGQVKAQPGMTVKPQAQPMPAGGEDR